MSNATVDSAYRWATVTPDDRGGVLYIAAFLGFTYSFLTFIARGFIKWQVLGRDDAAMAVAQIASIIQFGFLVDSISAGLGKNFALLNADQYAHMASAQYGNQITLYLSLGISKISTILLIQRLFTRDMKKAWVLCQIVLGAVLIWTVIAPFMVSVGCAPTSLAPKEPSGICSNIVSRYRFVVVTDAITDMILTMVPALLCWRLQMSISLKFQVFLVFAFRLPLVVLSVLFLKTWKHSLSSSNPGVDRSPAIVYQQIELCISLMAATIPCLKSFIRSFDTGSGVKANFGSSSNGYGSAGRTANAEHGVGQSYKLSTMSRSKASVSRSESQTRLKSDDEYLGSNTRSFTSGRLTPSLPRSKSVRDSDKDSEGSGSELFIRRDMHFEVTSEEMPEHLKDEPQPNILPMR